MGVCLHQGPAAEPERTNLLLADHAMKFLFFYVVSHVRVLCIYVYSWDRHIYTVIVLVFKFLCLSQIEQDLLFKRLRCTQTTFDATGLPYNV